MSKSYYEIIGVPKNATLQEIKKAWRKLSMKFHPDKLPAKDREMGTEKIKEINEAYGILSDEKKRKIFDMHGKEGLNGRQSSGGNSAFPFPFPFPGMNGHGRQQQKEEATPPIKLEEEITLEEVYIGKDIKKEIERSNLCSKCDATGYENKQKHACSSCRGQGVKMQIKQVGPGMIQQMMVPCPDCNSTGKDTKSSDAKCAECNGSSLITEKIMFEFKIPSGMQSGQMLKFENKGNERKDHHNRIIRGPVLVTITVKEHDLFKRGGIENSRTNAYNLVINLDISLTEALCGYQKTFIHLSGKKMCISEDTTIQDGEIKVIPGEGLPYLNTDSKKGNLFIKYNVKLPELSEDKKKELFTLLEGKPYEKDKKDKKDYDIISTITVDEFKSRNVNNNYDSDSEDNDDNNNTQSCRQQ